jgi:DNA polymerase eta
MELPVHRCIAHCDLDAFYAQVEAARHPRLAGRPLGVVQYNPFGNLQTLRPEDNRLFNDSNGSLIAVDYAARAAGVRRNMRGGEARALCPDLQLVQVPTAHGKADLTIYRDAGSQVQKILARGGRCERASIDEAYIDVTEAAAALLERYAGCPPLPVNAETQVHVCADGGGEVSPREWWTRPPQAWGEGERLLACGAAVVADLRLAVEAELGYTCSAGVAHTKLVAKLCSGIHKPAQQTLLPAVAVEGLLGPLPVPKLKALGGKFGRQLMEDLRIETVGQLAAVPGGCGCTSAPSFL